MRSDSMPIFTFVNVCHLATENAHTWMEITPINISSQSQHEIFAHCWGLHISPDFVK